MEKIRLILEDGSSFEGYSFGSKASVNGEVVFNTGMMGYPESLTDPSYNGQILVCTYPLIGNYGVPENIIEKSLSKNLESEKIQIRGLVVSEYSFDYSHWNAKKSLSAWMSENNIPGIYGIDTRELTQKLREWGVMLGKIVFDKDIELEDPNKINLVDEVSIKSPILYPGGKTKILLFDCGVKHNIIRCLLKRNVSVLRVPWDFDLTGVDFDGIILSNGPGDPKMCVKTIDNIKKAIAGRIPIFGVCLGNQILALASGADTYKLRYGHRSQNQPCIKVGSKRAYITSQNHGFAVDTKTLKPGWQEWFVNANDNTNEGIIHKSGLFRSVQFHPEANPGPKDTEFLFDEFLELVKKNKSN